jgi:hypothetical protein
MCPTELDIATFGAEQKIAAAAARALIVTLIRTDSLSEE